MKFILLILSAFLLASSAQAWTLNDVSILLPLPPPEQRELLLGPQTSAKQGELLPFTIYENLPSLVKGVNPQKLYSDSLKVIAFRIDPCFIERGTPLGCRRQIRMVWQPIALGGQGTFAMDAGIHTFYDLDETEWKNLLLQLRPLVSKDTNEALGIHPAILQEGLSGPTWTQFKKILLNFTGEKKLSRVTAMTVDTFNSIWVFSGFDVTAGVLKRIKIPRTDRFTQGFFLDITDMQEFRANVNPYPEKAAAWLNFLSNSLAAKESAREEDLRAALDQALRLENPRLEDTASVDCVSCHVAQSVRLWGERNTKWKWKKDFKETFYDSPMNLKNNSVNPEYVNRVRAFGYFMDEPIISQRLINESAEVLNNIRASEGLEKQ